MESMTIITFIMTNDPIIKLDCDCPHGNKVHSSIIFPCLHDAVEWLKANKFKPKDEETMFRQGRFTTAIISSTSSKEEIHTERQNINSNNHNVLEVTWTSCDRKFYTRRNLLNHTLCCPYCGTPSKDDYSIDYCLNEMNKKPTDY